MPINYSLYPKNWKTEIRPAILKRSEKTVYGKLMPCCEFCGLENRAIGYRDSDGVFFYSKQYQSAQIKGYGFYITTGYLKIVLTIAHLDHDINNNDPENLKALCQKCHLNYDKEHHQKNSKETRKKNKGIIELPL